jgi:hypothetical protein
MSADIMLPLRFLRLRRHRVTWLLWLALLLPLAQGAAIGHALSHAASDLSSQESGKALHAAHCELCLIGAALAGGGAPARPLTVLAAAVRPSAPSLPSVRAAPTAPSFAYLGRAPPLASC